MKKIKINKIQLLKGVMLLFNTNTELLLSQSLKENEEIWDKAIMIIYKFRDRYNVKVSLIDKPNNSYEILKICF